MILGSVITKFFTAVKIPKSVLYLLSIIPIFSYSGFSQSINDDLLKKDFSPKPSVSAPVIKKKTVSPKPAKQATKSVKDVKEEKKPVKKAALNRIEPAYRSNPSSKMKTQDPIKPVIINVESANPVKKDVIPQADTENTISSESGITDTPESVEEILGRFMDFEKSSSVTSKDWESIVEQTTKALQDNPNNIQAKARNLYAHGELSLNRNDFSNALIQFSAASKIMPDSALPYYGIGRVYMLTKQHEQAEEAFNNAIKREKNFALAYKGVGDALTAQQKSKKAQEYYEKAAEIGLVKPIIGNKPNKTNAKVDAIAPPVSPYLRDLNEARRMTGSKKWKESNDKLNMLLADNKTADVYIAMGDNYSGLEQMLSAQQAYRKATEVDSNSALAYFKLGEILFELNEFEAAADALDRALALDEKGISIKRENVKKMADKAKEKLKN